MRSLIFILFSLFCYANLYGQQNYFNVPSADLTEKGQWFFQHQLNNAGAIFQNNITLDYGLKKNLEVGINILNLDFNANNRWNIMTNESDPKQPLSPLVLANVQKQFKLLNNSIMFGIQGGTMASASATYNFAYWHYGLFRRQMQSVPCEFSAGYYLGNSKYLGAGSKAGFMAGMDYVLLKRKKNRPGVHWNADFIYGSNAISVAVPGTAIEFGKHFFLSLGRQIPFSSSNASKAWVMEFTFK